jgi:hypothetical protein
MYWSIFNADPETPQQNEFYLPKIEREITNDAESMLATFGGEICIYFWQPLSIFWGSENGERPGIFRSFDK